MKTKLIGIIICMLLIATAIPAIGTMKNKTVDLTPSLKIKSATTDVVWSDNFDSYSLGQFLDGDPEDGGWKICPCPFSEGAYVVDDQSLSNPHSVEIVGLTDIVHEFTGIRSGNWTLIFWVYVPTSSSSSSTFALDSYFPDPWDNKLVMRQLTVVFYVGIGRVYSYPDGPGLPLITGQWVELRIEFDLEADWLECYYNDELLIAKNWTEDTGFRNLAALTLAFFSDMETPIYHDDFSLEGEATGPVPNLNCDGSIIRDKVKPWSTVEGNFTVENIGEPNSRLEWIVADYPEWCSNWRSQPLKGMLTPEDDPMTVEVSFKVPDYGGNEFDGVIKVCAIGDPDDYHEIQVKIHTKSRNRAMTNLLFLRFLEQFPILQKILLLLQR